MRRTLSFIAVTAALVFGGGAAATSALAATSPSVTTGGASHHETYSTLSGTINPNGAGTTYFFQWGTSTAYGSATPTGTLSAGASAVTVHATISHLTPGTTYHYRLVATNSAGTSVGDDRTVTTTGFPPPDVTTGPASSLSTTSAVANGTINPRGEATTWTVQYGTTPSYGVETFSGSLAAGNSPDSVSAALHGLASGTIFHYRFVARHGSSVVTYGADQQFMTYPATRPIPSVQGRTRPHVARHQPYVFTTTGSVSHPSWIPATYACTGHVRVRWYLGRRVLKSATVPLQPNCTYTAQVVFRRRWKHQLNGFIRFFGNGYLAPATATHSRHITVG